MSLAERLERIDDFRWRIPRDDSLGMRTDVVVYATKKIIDKIAAAIILQSWLDGQ